MGLHAVPGGKGRETLYVTNVAQGWRRVKPAELREVRVGVPA